MKKTISLLLVLVLFANMSIGISAIEKVENYVPITQITVEELTNCALNLAKDIVPDVKLRIGDTITPIYDQFDALIGYSIEYFHGETPYGYLNLDFRKANPYADFCIDENCTGLYDSILSVVIEDKNIISALKLNNTANKQTAFSKKMYSIGPGTYGVSTINDLEIYTPINAKMVVKASVLESSSRSNTPATYNSHADIYSSSYSGTLQVFPVQLNPHTIISQNSILAATDGYYACAVLALTEIADQEGILYNNDIGDTFLELWDYTESYVNKVVGDNHFGVTPEDYIESGMNSYVMARGHSINSSAASTPSFSFFRNMIDTNRSGVLSYGLMLQGQTTPSEHAISVFGYCVSRVSGVTTNYLIVADGWNANRRFINYSETDFDHTYGISFFIT